jgi:hypothetical protein
MGYSFLHLQVLAPAIECDDLDAAISTSEQTPSVSDVHTAAASPSIVGPLRDSGHKRGACLSIIFVEVVVFAQPAATLLYPSGHFQQAE